MSDCSFRRSTPKAIIAVIRPSPIILLTHLYHNRKTAPISGKKLLSTASLVSK